MSRQKCEEEFEIISGSCQIRDYWEPSCGFSWHRLLRRTFRRSVFMAALVMVCSTKFEAKNFLKQKFNFILLSIFFGAIAAITGHCYALYHVPSERDIVAAYLLGFLVAFFSYQFLSRNSILGLDRATRKVIAEEIAQEQNKYSEPPFYEHEFYYNRWHKGFDLLLFTGMLIVALYFIWAGRFIVAGLLGLVTGFVYTSAFKQFFDRSPQIRIAERGIWLKHFGYKPWDSILRIKIYNDQSGKTETPTLDIFLQQGDPDFADFSLKLNDLSNWKQIPDVLTKAAKTKISNNL